MTFLQRLACRLRFLGWARLRLNRHSSFYISCSQFGEDMIVRHLLQDVHDGFYVDIGAHHPVYGSNTYHFYHRGWRGINVDAISGSMETFNLIRPRDINVEACVDAVSGQNRQFFVFDAPAFNTVCAEEAERITQSAAAKLVAQQPMTTTTLRELLDQYLPPGQKIAFLTIDVEGLDYVVLKHHDFNRYRPQVLVFERREANPAQLGSDSLVTHLLSVGYELAASTGPSIIMRLVEPA